jgi:hypothetical protein
MLSSNHCRCGKAITIIYSECVSIALVMQPSKRLCCILMPSVACLAIPYFSTLFHKRNDFQRNIKCVFWLSLQLLSKTFLILRSIQRHIIITVYRSSCTVPVIFGRFESRFIFWAIFVIILIFYEIPPSRSLVVPYGQIGTQTDRRTVITRLLVFRSIAKAPRNDLTCIIQSCSVCVSIFIHTFMNTTILQLVSICDMQLQVSALYVGHHDVVQRTYSVTTQCVW